MKELDCQGARELLPWFVRGALSPDEQGAVEAHLAGCPACRHELADTRRAIWIATRHLPPELLADYGAGLPLGAWPRELVEAHLADCAECQEDLALAAAPAAPAAVPLRRTAMRAVWRPLALAAGLVAAVGVGWLGGRGALAPRSQMAPAAPLGRAVLAELAPESARTRALGETLSAPRATPLALVLQTDLIADAPDYRLRILSPEGAPLHEVGGLAPNDEGDFVVLIDARAWPPGELRLELEGSTPAGWTPFESYLLRLDR